MNWLQPTEGPESNNAPRLEFQAGVRRCPNQDCRAPVFVILKQKKLYLSLPPEVVDFDNTDVPSQIASSLSEAILCHGSSCYKASALLVRRTLEEICKDQNASGKDLKVRLKNLGDKTTISGDMLDAADELRLLGNDAAHVDARDYEDIGKLEAELAIELAKEIVKAVYQQKTLAEKLRALKGKGDTTT